MPSKYGNRHVTEVGYTFDSQAENRHYRELKLLAAASLITDLQVHPRYPLVVNGVRICIYEADFSYKQEGETRVVDVKSPATRTPVYRLKAKLMQAIYSIEVIEVMS